MSSVRQSLRRTPACQAPRRRWSIARRSPSANIPQQHGSRARVPPAGELTHSDLGAWQTMEAAGIEPAQDSGRTRCVVLRSPRAMVASRSGNPVAAEAAERPGGVPAPRGAEELAVADIDEGN